MENSELNIEEAIAHVEASLENFKNVFDRNPGEPLPWLADVGVKEVVKAAEPHVPPRYPAAKMIDEYLRDQEMKKDDRKSLTVGDLLLMFELILVALQTERSKAAGKETNEMRAKRSDHLGGGTSVPRSGFLPPGQFPMHHHSFAADHLINDKSDRSVSSQMPVR